MKCFSIGVDLMGSDCSPAFLFKGLKKAFLAFPFIQWVIFVTPTAWEQIRKEENITNNYTFKICLVSDVIEMEDNPLLSIRQKKFSSLVIGLKQLRKLQIQAFVTAGHTGALVAGATLFLPLLPYLKRPALLALLPVYQKNVVVIDVGGNIYCKASHLVQFAYMAQAYQCYINTLCTTEKASFSFLKIGLLNIGTESKKGTAELKETYRLLQEKAEKNHFIFLGNIEPHKVFEGEVDVVVTDGFTGNILIKTAEGMCSFMLQQLQKMIKEEMATSTVFDRLSQQFNKEKYSSALLCGIDRIVVKCHGHSSPEELFTGISQAVSLLENNFLSYLNNQLKIVNNN